MTATAHAYCWGIRWTAHAWRRGSSSLYATFNAGARGTGNEAVLAQLQALRGFMESFDLAGRCVVRCSPGA